MGVKDMTRDVLRSFKIVVFSLCFLCIICKCTWAGPNIKFDQISFDFGKVIQGKSVTHIFKFENIGDGPLKINKVRAG
jgi:hypothetical protein